MRPGLRTVGLVAGCAAALAACGSSSHTSTAASGSSSGASGEAGKPAGQILADAAGALRGASGYVMQGQLTQSGIVQHVRVVAGRGSLQLVSRGEAGSFSVIILPTGAYIRVDQAFLNSHGAAHAGLVPNRWIQIPPASAQTLALQLGQFSPRVVARCLVEDHGTLSVAGRTTVAGRPAVVIHDAGNAPGDAPGNLTVATTGNPYPLAARQTGPKRAGGRIDVCNDGRAEDSLGRFSFSQFGSPPPITAPSHAAQSGQQSGVV